MPDYTGCHRKTILKWSPLPVQSATTVGRTARHFTKLSSPHSKQFSTVYNIYWHALSSCTQNLNVHYDVVNFLSYNIFNDHISGALNKKEITWWWWHQKLNILITAMYHFIIHRLVYVQLCEKYAYRIYRNQNVIEKYSTNTRLFFEEKNGLK